MLDGSSIEAMKERLPYTVKEDGERKIIVPQFEIISISEKYSKHHCSKEEDEFDSPILEEVYPCDCRYNPDIPLDKTSCGINSNCINRTLMIECSPTECPTRDNCQNQKIRKQQFADIEVFETPGKGFGIRALQDLPKGTMVLEYVGEIIDQRETEKRILKYSKRGMSHFYFMTLRPDMIIDATDKGNLSRFMNHSCAPNCATQKWIVDGKMRIALYTEKKIHRLQELTFDYKAVRVGSKPQVCLCGESCCKGFIGEEPKDSSSLEDDEDEDDAVSSPEQEKFKSLHRFMNGESHISIDDLMDVYKAMLKISDSNDPLLINLLSSLNISIRKDPSIGRKFINDLHGFELISFLIGANMKYHNVLDKCIDLLLCLPPSPDHRLNEKIVKISELKEGGTIPQEIIKKSLLVSFSDSFKIPKVKEFIVNSGAGAGAGDQQQQQPLNLLLLPPLPPPPPPPPLPNLLPPNWKIAYAPSDPNNPLSPKVPYYYHSITKEVSWEKPINNDFNSINNGFRKDNRPLITTQIQLRREIDDMVASLLRNRPPLSPSLRQRLYQSVWDKESSVLKTIAPPLNTYHKQIGRIRNFILHYLSEHGVRIRDGH